MKQTHKPEFRGPFFKSENHYLTQEGYPLGTTCWYVRVELNGLITNCCADNPRDAIKKALTHARQQDRQDLRDRFIPRRTLCKRALNRWGRLLLRKCSTIPEHKDAPDVSTTTPKMGGGGREVIANPRKRG